MKKLSTLLSIALAISLCAQTRPDPIEGARGRGNLTAISGSAKADFGLDVVRILDKNNAEVVRGEAGFALAPVAGKPPIGIMMRADAISTSGNTAIFSGKGVLNTVNASRQRVQIKGTVSIEVADLHKPKDADTNKDTYAIKFVGEDGTTFTFAGVVGMGDLMVKAKSSSTGS